MIIIFLLFLFKFNVQRSYNTVNRVDFEGIKGIFFLRKIKGKVIYIYI